MNKTKVMISGERQKLTQKAARWPCGGCGRGVGTNSTQCTSCQKWVHKKCSGIKGSMSKVIGASANLELMDKFCYYVIS